MEFKRGDRVWMARRGTVVSGGDELPEPPPGCVYVCWDDEPNQVSLVPAEELRHEEETPSESDERSAG